MTQMIDLVSRRMTPAEAAEYLGVEVQTLAAWRANKRYDLPYIKLTPRCVRYELADLERFVESRRVGGNASE